MKRKNSKTVGERTEGIILSEFLKHGEVVLLPFGDNQSYDLVLDQDGKFLRVQCKTVHLENGCITCPTHRDNWYRKTHYSYQGEIDIFAFYCVENQKVYIIPINLVSSLQSITLRIDPSRNSQKLKVRWATEFEYY
jgi:hypothetical protein